MQKGKNNGSISMLRAAELLVAAQDILVIFHASPDGDAIGSAFALCGGLQKLGKRARCACADPVPPKYAYLTAGLKNMEFEPQCVVTVDLAAPNLFGESHKFWAGRVDLCVDHHVSNTRYARNTLLDTRAAATCEIIFRLLKKLNVELDKYIADCIYTGVATDTGCFRYSNTTPKTLRCAAELIERGARSAEINKKLFETTSRQRMNLEREAMNTLEYFSGGRAALICITEEMRKSTGVDEYDLEGVASLPGRIEGVLAGVTVKEKGSGVYKISLRTGKGVNASEICASLGGGGHAAAAGCQITGTLEQARATIRAAVEKALEDADERNSVH